MEKSIQSIKKINWIITALFFGFIFLVAYSCNQGPPENSRAAQAQRGKAHFKEYCAVCHGEDAKGIKIDTLNKQPADLTQILATRRISTFPVLEIARMIDGRNMAVSHGTRQMPIWGEVFSKEEYLDEKQIKGKLGEIIAYLMSIQGK